MLFIRYILLSIGYANFTVNINIKPEKNNDFELGLYFAFQNAPKFVNRSITH